MITRKVTDISAIDFNSGEVILIDKTIGKPSFNVIYKLRKSLGIKKAGYAGTLDPRASGLLIICTGKKTKEIESYQNLAKTYTGVITLGKSTPSMDSETEPLEVKSIDGITPEDILKTREEFLGDTLQVPPMYSAVKYKGKSLYKYARKGIQLEIQPKQINISKFDIVKIDLPDIYFEISCSKGTYIRVIAHEFGQKLECGAYLSQLRRTKVGEFNVEDAFTIDELIDLQKESL